MTNQIDLHIHTNHSDGNQTVAQVIEKARHGGVKTISITDHNSVGAYDELENIDAKDLKIVRGVELYYTEDWNGRRVNNEVLGYNIDIEKMKTELSKMDGIVKSTEEHNLEILRKKFSTKGFKISQNVVLCDTLYHNSLKAGRIILNDILLHAGNAELVKTYKFNKNTAIYDDHLRSSSSPFYSPELCLALITLKDCSDAIHACGGVCFMAHIFKRTGLDEVTARGYLLRCFKEKLIDGIEVFHPFHTQEQIEFLKTFCQKHKIPMSGGTDNHNLNVPLGGSFDNLFIKV